ncbi:uncharacterized protein LOC123684926 [Harmonia axyridis]|uniref:uncharacterized protein LOC123684926 n=1 Tax=Harmonia axyridis TaxID=115357 RepID=UPI001E276882|nr:uncharacterized protein LOC123684926 [Harmonia axyridis]
MKLLSGIFISAVFIGITQGHIIGILRDFSPIIADISGSIDNLLRDTGGLIGHTFSSIDSAIESAEDSISQLSKSIEQILVGCPDDQHSQQCAEELRAVSQGVNNTIVKICVDETRIRNTLSAKLVEISKLRTQCESTFTQCLKTPPVDQCIQTGINSVKTGIQEKEVTLKQDVETIKTQVSQCVNTRAEKVCGTLQNAVDDYKRCIGEEDD